MTLDEDPIGTGVISKMDLIPKHLQRQFLFILLDYPVLWPSVGF